MTSKISYLIRKKNTTKMDREELESLKDLADILKEKIERLVSEDQEYGIITAAEKQEEKKDFYGITDQEIEFLENILDCAFDNDLIDNDLSSNDIYRIVKILLKLAKAEKQRKENDLTLPYPIAPNPWPYEPITPIQPYYPYPGIQPIVTWTSNDSGTDKKRIDWTKHTDSTI